MDVNATALLDVDVDRDGVACNFEAVQEVVKSGAITIRQREGFCAAAVVIFVGLLATL